MKSTKIPKLFDLTGKTAIVTGAASGIGRAVALDLAEFGADVVIADVAIADAEKVAKEIESMGRQALVVKTDVSKQGEVKQMVEATVNKFGKIDILVNCAGILGTYSGVAIVTEEEWNRVMNVNLLGTLLCCQAVMEHMIDNRSGKIVNVGSSMSSRGSTWNTIAGGVHYNVSKAAVQCLTRCLAWELASQGINVNAVAPGTAITPMHTGEIETIKQYLAPSIPLGRLAEPEDIADVVLFLVTDAARYIIGQTIHVNGGQIMVD